MGRRGRADGIGRVAAWTCLIACLAWAPARASAPGWAIEVAARSGTLPAEIPGALEPFRLAPRSAGGAFAEAWRSAAAGIAADRAVLAACRVDPAGCPDPARRFLALVAQAGAQTGRARLGILNRAINLAITYTSDLVQHGRDDVWSAPLATFASRMGDCEDYAIAKYVALIEAGTAPEDVRIVVVDERWSGLHAVASVRLDGAWLVLDNRRMALIEDRDLPAYRALATFDERSGNAAPMLAEAADPSRRATASASPEPAS